MGEAVVELLDPIRLQVQRCPRPPEELEQCRRRGAEKAHAIADGDPRAGARTCGVDWLAAPAESPAGQELGSPPRPSLGVSSRA